MKAESSKVRTTRARKPPASASREWTEEQRQSIAELAYQRFTARGGEHGYELDDWLEAEKVFAAALAARKRRRAAAAAKS